MTDERKRDLLREILTMKKYNYTLAPDWVFTEIVFAISRPETPTGKWEFVDDGPRKFICSVCNKRNIWASNFCPHCGSSMMEEGDKK